MGQSVATIDMAGEGAADNSASWRTAGFDSLQLNSGVTYYVAFTTERITDATSWDSVSFAAARLRIGKKADGVVVGEVYSNADFSGTQTGGWGPQFKAEVTTAAVPEPATASLGLLGLAALLMRRRRA